MDATKLQGAFGKAIDAAWEVTPPGFADIVPRSVREEMLGARPVLACLSAIWLQEKPSKSKHALAFRVVCSAISSGVIPLTLATSAKVTCTWTGLVTNSRY